MTRQLFDAAAMLPPAWQAQAAPPVRIFNPAILCLDGQWVLAYRVDFKPDGHHIAICRLDERLRVQPATVLPLSDLMVDGGLLPQDPRLIRYQGRLWLYYDYYRPGQPNCMVLVELDLVTLRPIGAARPLLLAGPRQRTEKSWQLFVHAEELYAVYRLAPHVILHLDLSPSDHVICRPIHRVVWDDHGYARRYGELRGGTPPVRMGDYYYSFFHSWSSSSRLDRLARPAAQAAYYWLKRRRPTRPTSAIQSPLSRGVEAPLVRRTLRGQLLERYRRRFEQRWYVVGFYAFRAQPPFAPVCFTPQPILAPQHSDSRLFAESLNPYADRSVFPCGAVLREDGQWVVSYGLNDEQAAFCTFEHQALLSNLAPVL